MVSLEVIQSLRAALTKRSKRNPMMLVDSDVLWMILNEVEQSREARHVMHSYRGHVDDWTRKREEKHRGTSECARDGAIG